MLGTSCFLTDDNLYLNVKIPGDLQGGKKANGLSRINTCGVCFGKLHPIVYKQMLLCNQIVSELLGHNVATEAYFKAKEN